MRGYFGVGVEGISKEQNVGTIARSAHSFGASFFFTINPDVNVEAMRTSDTSDAFDHLPYYQYSSPEQLELPMKCTLVGVEFVNDSIELPSFRHPKRAAYILGPEMGNLSDTVLDQCHHVVKIPMKFCVNVGVAAAIMMYDRMICMGSFAERPVKVGGPLIDDILPQRVTMRRKIKNKNK